MDWARYANPRPRGGLLQAARALRPGDRVAATAGPLEYRTYAQDVSNKPKGLWYACGPQWIEFVAYNLRDRFTGINYLYRLDVDESRLLHVRSSRQAERLTRELGVPDPEEDPSDLDYWRVDWRRVAERYAGFEACPYSRGGSLQWYELLDVPSGVVWDPTAIRGAELVWSRPTRRTA